LSWKHRKRRLILLVQFDIVEIIIIARAALSACER